MFQKIVFTIVVNIILNSFSNGIPLSEYNETNLVLSLNSRLSEMRTEQELQKNLIREQGKLIDGLAKKSYLHNCVEVKSNGIYEILHPNFISSPFKVACEAYTRGGGWTIILRRIDGSVNFYRSWNAYKKGFGDLDGEFFLGLDKIHALTAEYSQELLVVLEDFEGAERFETYEKFAIGNEDELYALNTLGKANGTAGDSLRTHYTTKFSTFDRINNINGTEKCNGGWWYKSYINSNLAGTYNVTKCDKGVSWDAFRGCSYSLKRAIMMIRPRNKF